MRSSRRAAAAAPALALFLALLLAVAAPALAATPTSTPAAGGDPRSSGEGPGLVGEPLVAIVVVVAIGLGALGATMLYVRLTGGSRSP